jgi:hypothetical protein
MLRTRVLRPWWLTVVLILWAVAWLSLPAPGEGAPLPPVRASTEEAGAAVDVTALQTALVAQGLSPADAERVMARLTPSERAELAQRAQEVAVGGDATLLIVVGVILLLAILLYLPLAGRMQGWWQ